MYTYIVVDDEPLIRRGTIKKLEGFQNIDCIGQASNGEGALKLMEEKNPDFVITDMRMPIMDGTRLLPVLSTRYPEKYIIVISGYKDFEYAQQALRANTLDYIVKPFSQETLWEAVQKAVSRLENRQNLRDKLTLNEKEKEELKYEYDKQILKNLLWGLESEQIALSCEQLKEVLREPRYILVTVNLNGRLDEKGLKAFLQMREKELTSVVLTRENTENMGFLLFFFKPGTSGSFREKILRVKSFLDGYFADCQVTPFYGISQEHGDLLKLHEAFLETADALNGMTFFQEQNYIFYGMEAPKTGSLEWLKLERFLFVVEAGHTDEVGCLLPELFHYFARTKGCRLKDAKDYCLEIAETLKKALPKEMQVHKSTAVSLNLLNNLNFVFSFQELEDYFLLFFTNMTRAFESAGFYTEENVIGNIKKYIELHYEKDLTLDFVSSLFRLNRSYLSSAFKARMGMGFVDFVNLVRVKKAKELLKSTDKKTYQIAQAVGYGNVKYFFRVFKKAEGITPEEYRNSKA